MNKNSKIILYGSWEALGRLKILPQGPLRCSTPGKSKSENFVFIYCWTCWALDLYFGHWTYIWDIGLIFWPLHLYVGSWTYILRFGTYIFEVWDLYFGSWDLYVEALDFNLEGLNLYFKVLDVYLKALDLYFKLLDLEV